MEEKGLMGAAIATGLATGGGDGAAHCTTSYTARSEQAVGERLTWSELVYRGRRFTFNRGLTIKVDGDEEGWEMESEDLELIAFGHNRSEAESVFREMFAVRWDMIVLAEDDKLSWDAVELKQKYLSIAKEQKADA